MLQPEKCEGWGMSKVLVGEGDNREEGGQEREETWQGASLERPCDPDAD